MGRPLHLPGLAAAALTLALFPLPGCAPGPQSPPNVVVWLVDTLRADRLGCYGHDRDTSPVIDSLAEGGVLFEEFHVHSNWTQPSVASLLSGCYPPSFAEDFTSTVPEGLTMAAEWFGEQGYATAGMTVTTATAARYGFGQGFRVYEQLDMRESPRDRKHREGPVFDAQRVVDSAISWLDHRRPAGRPFFLYLHTVDPHAPYDSHEGQESFAGPYDGPVDGSTESLADARREGYEYTQADRRHLLDLYDDEVRYNDGQLGRLLQALEDRALREDTLVIVVSDHGEEFWERGDLGHGHHNLHGELTHVPLVLSWPRGLPAGRRVTGMMRGIDLLPTVLELCGLPPLPDADGSSVASAVRSGRGLEADRAVVFAGRSKEDADTRAVRGAEFLFHQPREGPAQLFDLTVDADARVEAETTDAETWHDLERRLDRWEDLRAERSEAWREGRTRARPDEEARRALEALGYLGADGR